MQKYGKYIGTFIFSLMLLFLVPLAGDDWGNYLAGENGFLYAFVNAYKLYFTWEGRFVSRVLVTLFTRYKWLWNIISSLLITSTIYMGMKFIEKKQKKMMFSLMCGIFLFMNFYTFSQIIPWVTGNIYYFVVIPILLWYFYFLLNNDEYNNWRIGLFILINVLCTMFVENMAVVLVCGNVLLILYKYIRNKSVDKVIVFYTIVSILSTLLMIMSPGSSLRSVTENNIFNELNLVEKIIYNIPNFVNYTFIINPYLLILLVVSSLFIINKKINKRWLKLVLGCFIVIGPIISVLLYPVSLFATKTLYLVDPTKVLIIIYWLVYLAVYLYLIIINDKSDLIGLFLLFVGLSSNVAMMLSPTWGYRTSFFTYFMFCIVCLRVINTYIKESKLVNYLSYIFICCGCLFYLVFYINVYRCQIDLEKSINKQLMEERDVIYVSSFPSFVSCNINPMSDYHMESFKKYYGIPAQKKVIVEEGNWKYIIFYKG